MPTPLISRQLSRSRLYALIALTLVACATPTLAPEVTEPSATAPATAAATLAPQATEASAPTSAPIPNNVPPTAPEVMDTGDVYYIGEPIPVTITATVSTVNYSLAWVKGDRSTFLGEAYTGASTVVEFPEWGRLAFIPTARLAKKGVYLLSGENIAPRRVLLVDPLPAVNDPLTWPFGLITTTDKIERGAAMAEEFYRAGVHWFHFDYPIGEEWYFDGPPSINAIGRSAEPDAGRISAGFEAFVNRAHALGLQPIMKLLNHYEQIAEPQSLTGPFYSGLRKVQTYYKGKLKYWTIGNEVEGGGYSRFTPEQYAQVVKDMSAVLKGVDPEVKVIAGEFYSAEGNVHLDALLQAPYRDAWDILSGHKVVRMENGNAPASGYKERLRAAGLQRPFWDTEAEGTIFGGPSEWTGYMFSAFPTSPDRDMHSSVAKHMLRVFCLETQQGGQWVLGFFNPDSACLGADLFTAMHYNANWEEQWSLRKHWISDKEQADEQNHKVAGFRTVADMLYGSTGLTRIPNLDAADPAAPGTLYSGADGYVYRHGAEYFLALWRNTGNEGQDRELVLTTDPRDTLVLFDSFGTPHPLKNDNGVFKVGVRPDVVYVRGFSRLPEFALEKTSNDAPYFVTQPPPQAAIGQPYTYNAWAYDSDPLPAESFDSLPALTYELVSGPAGMTLTEGLLTWTPAVAGDFPVTVRVSSTQGAPSSTEQTFTITVVEAEAPPPITSQPLTTFARPGYGWVYNVNAYDLSGGAVTFALKDAPAGMVIDPATGFIQWTPDAAGEHTFTITAASAGGVSEQVISIRVSD